MATTGTTQREARTLHTDGLTSAAHAPAAPAEAHRPHLPRRAIFIILLLILLGATGWWASTTQWTPPWVQPPGPLAASGTLEADEVLVGAQVSGQITELAQEGQPVQANDIVAKLDDSLIQLQILQADTAQLQRLRIQDGYYQLRSPISGVVTHVPMHIGEVVSPGQTVAAVADLTNLKLTVYVLERDLGQVRVGQQVAVTADPFGTRAFHGVVTSINQSAEFTPRNVQTQEDRLNLVFGVQVRVDNPDEALKPGMPGDATFTPLP